MFPRAALRFSIALVIAIPAIASAQSAPPIVLSQVTWLNTLQGGAAISSGDPAGTSFAVNQNGDVILANTSELLLFNGQTGAVTTLGTWSNAQPVTVDSNNNLYVANLNNDVVVKVPFVNGAYAAFKSSPVGACTGNDTVACTLPNLTGSGNFQTSSMAFDAHGDFFWATNHSGATTNSIFECSTACLAGSGGAVLLYQEPTSDSDTGQLMIGGMAVDPWGNLFFTDSSIVINTSSQTVSYYSDVKELPTSTGAGYGGATTGYAAGPTVLLSENEGTTPPPNDDELDGVAVDSNGTVYIADQDKGIFAFPNNGGTIPLTSGQPTYLYGISRQGGKSLAIDGKGNLYVASYSTAIDSGGEDTLARIAVSNLTVSASPAGTAATATNVTVTDAGGDCTLPGTITFTAYENGAKSTEFSGVTNSCSSQGFGLGDAFATTVTFTPTRVGERSAMLSASDGTNSGTAVASGIGQGPMLTLDPGVLIEYTTGFTYPAYISVDGNGDLAVPNGGGGNVYVLPSGTLSWVSVGTGFTNPQSTAFDANGNLYVADASTNAIFEVANTNTTGGFTAGTTTTLLSDTATIGGTKLNEPQGLTVGPDGVLYISDLGNNRVVSYNLSSGVTGVRVTGLSSPVGLAVDGAGNLYVANESNGTVVECSGGGVVTTFSSIPGVSTPWEIAVDASGSLLIADAPSGNIVRVPNESGVLTVVDAITVATNPKSAYGIAIDNSGNAYTTDPTQQESYVFQRTSASVTFGLVDDGDTSAAMTRYAENAGNTALTLGTPFVTGLTGPFTEAPGASNGCADGDTNPAGSACQFDVTFAPTSGETGVQSGSFTLNSNASMLAAATVSLYGTAVVTPPSVSLSAASLSYGDEQVGTASASKSVTLTNTGGSLLTITSFSVTGANASSFVIANSCGTSLAAGASCIIHGHFAPAAAGAATATIKIADNASGSPQSVALTGTGTNTTVSLSATKLSYGGVTVGTTSASESVTLTNTGSATLSITSIAVTGANASSFGFANSCGTSLAAGANCTIHGHFAPAAAGAATAAIAITDTAAGTPQSIALTGTGTNTTVSLSATSLSYGDVTVGTASASKSVTLTNTGSATLAIASIAVTGANASSFGFANSCGTSLAAGANCSIHGHFAPAATGAMTAAIAITDTASGTPQSIALTGTGTNTTVSLSATSLSYGDVTVGTASASKSVTLTNTGSATLAIAGIAVTGTNASSFGFANSCGTSLAAGANCSIHGHFAPAATGAMTAAITITDTASGTPQSIALTGTGTNTTVSLSATSLSYGDVTVGTASASKSVTLTNTGSATLAIAGIAVTGTNASSFVFANNCGTSLAAGANCTIHGHFAPAATGAMTAAIVITDTATGTPQNVTLSGTGD